MVSPSALKEKPAHHPPGHARNNLAHNNTGKPPQIHSSLKRRAVVFLLLLIATVGAALSSIHYITMSDMLVGNLEAHGTSTALNLADNVTLGILLEDPALLSEDVSGYLREDGIDYIWIVNKNGTPVLSTYLPLPLVANQNKHYSEALKTGKLVKETAYYEKLSRDETRSETLHVAVPVWHSITQPPLDDASLQGLTSDIPEQQREIIGAVQVGFSKKKIDKQLSSLALRAAFFSLCVSIAAAVLAAAILQKWLRPLQAVTDMAKTIRLAGFQRVQENIDEITRDYNIPISNSAKSSSNPNHEIEQLYQTFMEMLSELSAYDQRIREQKMRLKDMVADQTAELLQAKTEAENANNTKSTFLASMSHEIRTPLNTVIGFTQILRQSPENISPEQQENYLRIIHESAHNLLTVIDDILNLSRLEAGQYELNITHFNIASCAYDTEAFLARKAEEKNVAIKIDCPEMFISSDIRLIKHIMLNVLDNAVKFSQVDGIVSLTVKELKDYVTITVTDNGPGMSEDELEQAVQPFVQASGSRFSRKTDGPGLGLPLLEHFVRLLGGTLAIYSEKQQGTVVRVKIPKETPPTASVAQGIHSPSIATI